MNTKFTLKNFRCFDSKGVTIDLRPITLLTGCNSSGKSSIVKALMLLSDYFQELKNQEKRGEKLNPFKRKLNFTKKPFDLLGDFSQVINSKSKSVGESTVSMGFRVDNAEIYLEFKEDKEDIFRNGCINTFKIKELNPEETVLCVDNKVNFKNLLSEFFSTQQGLSRYEKFLNSGLVFYFPILESKLSGSKEECINFLKGTLKNDIISKIKAKKDIERIIDDFSKSEDVDFISWYKHKEQGYWEELSQEEIAFDLTKMRLNALGSYYRIDDTPENEDLKEIVKTSRKDRFFFHDANGFPTKFRKILEDLVADDSIIDSIIKGNESKEEPKHEDVPSFKTIVEIMDFLSYMYDEENPIYLSNYTIRREDRLKSKLWGDSPTIHNETEEVFTEFVAKKMLRFFYEQTPNAIQYVSSSVSNVKRRYSISEDDEITKLLRTYFYDKEIFVRDYPNLPKPGSFINKWVKEFGIGNEISIGATKGEVELRLHKSEQDTEGTLLADNGYGITQLFAIMLNIEVAYMESKLSNSVRTIAIEEPEIHLHPSYQSKLTDMFYEAYKEYGIHFIVETHSEYFGSKISGNCGTAKI